MEQNIRAHKIIKEIKLAKKERNNTRQIASETWATAVLFKQCATTKRDIEESKNVLKELHRVNKSMENFYNEWIEELKEKLTEIRDK